MEFQEDEEKLLREENVKREEKRQTDRQTDRQIEKLLHATRHTLRKDIKEIILVGRGNCVSEYNVN